METLGPQEILLDLAVNEIVSLKRQLGYVKYELKFHCDTHAELVEKLQVQVTEERQAVSDLILELSKAREEITMLTFLTGLCEEITK